MEAPDGRPGPAYSQTDQEGRRWYTFPGEERLLSVSTATGVIGSEGLVIWSANLAAAAAFVELPTIITSSRIKPCERTWNRCKHDDWRSRCERCPCGTCRTCVTKWLADRHHAESGRRSDEGTRTHDVIEWWALHNGEIRPHAQDIAPYVAAFLAFVAEYGLTPASFLVSECTVISRAHRYAGTTDGIIRFDARATPAAAELVARVLFAAGEYQEFANDRDALIAAVVRDSRTVDLVFDTKTQEKTREKAKFYPDQALQDAGYRHAPVIRIKDTDVETAMPDTDGGLILQLRPDGFTPRLVVSDDATFEAFLHALELCRWLLERGTAAVSSRSFPLPPKKKAPAKRAPRDAAAPPASTLPVRRRSSVAAAIRADPFAGFTRDAPAGARLTESEIPF